MNVEHTEFIGIYRNVFPEQFCSHLISEFDVFANKGAGQSRKVSENAARHEKDDHQLFYNVKNNPFTAFNNMLVVDVFFDGLQACFEEYAAKYSVLQTAGALRATSMKMQRTSSGGGYHLWHAEQGGNNAANRAIAYMLYLNTLPKESNGETEFLYQQKRFNPEENTLLLWPAAYTHAHRGNPVFGEQAKYIVTGWFFYE